MKCYVNISETCEDVFPPTTSTLCATSKNGNITGSINNTVQLKQLLFDPICLNPSTMNIGGTDSTSLYLTSCMSLITSLWSSQTDGGNERGATDDTTNSIIVSVIVVLYFLVPVMLFIGIVTLRNQLYTKWGENQSKFKKTYTEGTVSTNSSEAAAAAVIPNATPEDVNLVPVWLSFHQLTYSVKMNTSSLKRLKEENDGVLPTYPGWNQKKILTNITGVVAPGTLNAIMGPSGCGKSTLLDVLADRKHGGVTLGKVLLNGHKRSLLFKRVAGYVMQFDALFPHLTVREVLTYSAELRIIGMDWEAKRAAVKQVIHDLDLSRVENTKIGGDGVPGISGGQARRVTVGVELVTRPVLLFLDEPTTGLDAFSSLQLVRTLRKLANTGRTVCATIHQPRPDIFNLFNNLLLMKDGRIAYFGEVSGIRSYFSNFGISIPDDTNVADFVVDLTYSKEKSEAEVLGGSANMVAQLADSYENSEQCSSIENIANELEKRTLPDLPPPAAIMFGPCNMETGEPDSGLKHVMRFSQPIHIQVFILLRRSYRNISRDRVYFMNIALQMSQFLFYGLLFLGLRTEPASSNSGLIMGITDPIYLIILTKRAFLFQVMNTVMLIEQVVIATAFIEKTIFRREHASGAYSIFSYHAQFIIRFYVEAIFKGMLAALLCYFFPPMNVTVSTFFYFAAMLMVCSTMGSSLAFFMVSLIPDAEGAANIHSQVLGTLGLYSGFFLFSQLLPVWMLWLYFMLPFKYSFEGLEQNEFSNCVSKNEKLNVFSLDPSLDRWTNLLVFMFYPPIFHALAMLGSFIHTRPKSYWVKALPCCFKAEQDAPAMEVKNTQDLEVSETVRCNEMVEVLAEI